MEMPKPVGCVLIALRSFPERWHVPSLDMAQEVSDIVQGSHDVLRALRDRRATDFEGIIPLRCVTEDEGHPVYLRLRMLEGLPIPLPEYAGPRIGEAEDMIPSARRRFLCFQIEVFYEQDGATPSLSCRFFFDPDVMTFGTVVASGSGLLYRQNELIRYVEALQEADGPRESAAPDPRDAKVQALRGLLEAHDHQQNAAALARIKDELDKYLASLTRAPASGTTSKPN